MESTRAITCERGSRAESKNCEVLLFPTADRRFDKKSNAPPGRPHFGSNSPLYEAQRESNAQGGDGQFWTLTGTLKHHTWSHDQSQHNLSFDGVYLFVKL